MIKLLAEAPTGQQEVIEIDESGAYFDPERVLWDERADGPLPEITLGGMVRVDGALVFDQAVLDARTPAAEAITVPMHKAREALIRSGVSIATISAAIDAIEDDTERELARNSWEHKPTVSSQSALVQTLGAALELDVDALFQYARALP